MKTRHANRIAAAVTAILAGSAAFVVASVADEVPHKPLHAIVPPPRPARLAAPHRMAPAIPTEEPNVTAPANGGFANSSAFSARSEVTPNATTISPPVTLTYTGSATEFQLTDGGTGRALSASLTNTNNSSSAVYGDTVGKGAAVTGINKGTAGPGGNFQVTNPNSFQAGLFASTNGKGSAIFGTSTNTAGPATAISGQSLSSATGVGVEGDGTYAGVIGYVSTDAIRAGSFGIFGGNDTFATTTDNYGVYGTGGSAIGVGATSVSNYGLAASSDDNYAVYATSTAGSAIYAETDSPAIDAYGVYATVTSGNAIEGVATGNAGYGVAGLSTDGIAVYALEQGHGTGIFASSATGWAGQFEGNVEINGTLTVGSTTYSSDRNLKTDVAPIDGKDLLERVSNLPISTWTYKNDPGKRHVGPMAQDFHAAFGLNGADERHINEVDVAGVSLAAIQELNNQMKIKDSQIAELKEQLRDQTRAMARMADALSSRMTALERQGMGSTQAVALRIRESQSAVVN